MVNVITNVKIEKIKVEKENRIRIKSGKDISDLKQSIEKLGLLHPIILNDNYKLLAGYRRLSVFKSLGKRSIPAVVKKTSSELEELDIEIEENWRRQNLTPYEMDMALARRKELYDKMHPEATKEGSYQKQDRNGRGQFTKQKTGETDVDSLSKSDDDNLSKIKNGKSDIDKKGKEGGEHASDHAERFTKATAELLNVSERTVQRRIRVGSAIKNKELDDKLVEDYKNGKVSHTKVLEEVKKNGKSKKEKPETPDQAEVKRTQHQKKETNSTSADVNYCKTCRKAKASTCPSCGDMVLICDRGFFVLKAADEVACDDYEA
ncbi:MAG: hypothetical protein GF353_06765 [Candidatus Lokiarchaeota archaeon]|nr:hypothetical protein [Candidatus Lokiarchaeota archaeon]